MNLPNYKNLDIAHFQRLFDNKSESYKLFWFRAVVDAVINGKKSISYSELIDFMITDAWYMVTEYRLNLGPRDNLEALVHYAQQITGLKSSEKPETILNTISTLNDKKLKEYKRTLTGNVPYRLQAPLTPYIKGDGWKGPKGELAERINSFDNLIYRFEQISGLDSTIVIDDDWADYIKKNYEIISGWIQYNLIVYLQRRNPSVPGISNKLSPPQERNLEGVKKYWKGIMEFIPVHEIYKGTELSTSDVSIDHFVPWSYVTHDELWNLSPTTRSINSSKSNNLPDWDIYFQRLCDLEFSAYSLAFEKPMIMKLQQECMKEHVNSDDVRFKLYRSGLSKEVFSNTLESIIRPVYEAAENMGFERWKID